MPSLTIHLAIAKEYLKKHPEENEEEFIKGTIFPDIQEDKVKAHYGKNHKTTDIIEYMQKKSRSRCILKRK